MKIDHLIDCIYEAQNSEICQIVGDHLDGIFNFEESGILYCYKECRANFIEYFLKHYKGIVRELHFSALQSSIKAQKLFKILQNCQFYHLVLFPNAGYAGAERQSCIILNEFFRYYPVVELHIRETKIVSPQKFQIRYDCAIPCTHQ